MKKTTKKTPCDKIPADFVYCFNKTCPRSAECLRFFLGEQSSERPEIGLCVFPRNAENTECPYYRTSQSMLMAWGLTPLFKDVYQKHSKILHERIYALLGSRASYYRYNSGAQLLSPEQQEEILSIFESLGYKRSDLSFGGYVESFDLSSL